MFCQKCGNQIEDNTRFCPKCGNSVSSVYAEQSPPSYVQQRQRMRQDEIAEIDKMVEYFSVKQNQYDEYDVVCERLDPHYLRKRPALLVWGIISGVFGVAFLVDRMIPVGIILLLGGVGLIFAFVMTTVARKKNYAAALQRYYELSDELYNYYLNYGPCLVSAGYTNPYNLMAVKQTIQSGRANTISDALNILLDDEHKAAMEEYSRHTAMAAEEAARSAGVAARNTAVGAVFSAANFFYNTRR